VVALKKSLQGAKVFYVKIYSRQRQRQWHWSVGNSSGKWGFIVAHICQWFSKKKRKEKNNKEARTFLTHLGVPWQRDISAVNLKEEKNENKNSHLIARNGKMVDKVLSFPKFSFAKHWAQVEPEMCGQSLDRKIS